MENSIEITPSQPRQVPREFNVADEPWIPASTVDGSSVALGLRDVLLRAHELRELSGMSPTELVAVHRLLIAVLTRAVSEDETFSRRAAYGGPLPADLIQAYLARWDDRLWLFHTERPFMQVPEFPEDIEERLLSKDGECRKKPAAKLSLDYPGANSVTLWRHAYYDAPEAVTAAASLRMLLGHLQFTTGAAVRVLGHSDSAAPLSGAAAVMPVGATLAETLLLNLSTTVEGDLPTWERESPSRKELGGPLTPYAGLVDRYTRLARSVLLLRENDGSVRKMLYGCGVRPARDENDLDPFVAYRVLKSKEKLRRKAVSFEEGRAWWRDLPCLLPDPGGLHSEAPASLNRARALTDDLGRFDAAIDVLIAGTAANQSTVLRWRILRSTVAGRFSHQPEAANLLRSLVERVEKAEFVFNRAATSAAASTIEFAAKKDARKRAAVMVAGACLRQRFFQCVEAEFERVQSALGGGCELSFASAMLDASIANALLDGARQMRSYLGASPRSLRAMAKLDNEVRRLRSKFLPAKPKASKAPRSAKKSASTEAPIELLKSDSKEAV